LTVVVVVVVVVAAAVVNIFAAIFAVVVAELASLALGVVARVEMEACLKVLSLLHIAKVVCFDDFLCFQVV
jgi:hypothetical protein